VKSEENLAQTTQTYIYAQREPPIYRRSALVRAGPREDYFYSAERSAQSA